MTCSGLCCLTVARRVEWDKEAVWKYVGLGYEIPGPLLPDHWLQFSQKLIPPDAGSWPIGSELVSLGCAPMDMYPYKISLLFPAFAGRSTGEAEA